MSSDPLSDPRAEKVTGPLPLTDPDMAWRIVRGAIELFSVPWQGDAPVRTGRHLGTCTSGQVLFGATPFVVGESSHILLAVPTADAALAPLNRASLTSEEGTRWIDAWVETLSASVSAVRRAPADDLRLPGVGESSLAAGRAARAGDNVVWVTVREAECQFLSWMPLTGSVLPLTATTWLLAARDVRLTTAPTHIAMREGTVWSGLEHLHRLVLEGSALHEKQQALADAKRLKEKAHHDEQSAAGGMARLAGVLAAAGGPPPGGATQIGDVLYRRLPDRPVKTWELARLALFGSGRDLGRIVLLVIAAGLLGMLPPLLTGVLFNTIIPGAQWGLLAQAALALVVAAAVVAVFEIVRTYGVMRIAGRFHGAVEAAVWDRLLRLPLSFFRTQTAGDLVDRANSFSKFRLEFSISSVSALLGVFVAGFNLVLLFFYGRSLVGVALLLLALLAAFTAGSILLGNLYYRRMLAVIGNARGQVLQLLTGLVKLRVAGAEGRAFSRWSDSYAEGAQAHEKLTRVDNAQAVFYGSFPLLTLLAVFAAVLAEPDPRQPIGDLLAFLVALTAVVTASTAAANSLVGVIKVVPTVQRLKPILHAVPETRTARQDPGLLSGALAVEHVCFAYQPDAPVLHDVSVHARPGEFIALVGPSGSGKSTLLRLLLGLDVPQSGSITYDHRDVSTLDLQAVRRQFGVVVQSGRLRPGTVFENIIGARVSSSDHPLTLDDAWEAARLSGLAADLELLPLGMDTLIGRDGSGLSGGQRQRVLIARALVRRPRILLLDEATSALDNRTQALVSASLERLCVTRVVIAHRLSTIRNADRIYVIDAGQVVQHGNYHELLRQGGLFAELAKRQLAVR